VVITPVATLVTKSATVRPLTARKPACGLSASRRPAISAAAWRARPASNREPTSVSHGPATTSPTMIITNPVMYATSWPLVVLGRWPTK
jgi:hypothetical protein